MRRRVGSSRPAREISDERSPTTSEQSRSTPVLHLPGLSCPGLTLSCPRRPRPTTPPAALAPSAPQTYLALGDYYSNLEKDWNRALEQYDQGRKVAPNEAELLTGIALVERAQGHFEQSMTSLRQALALDPRSAGTARRLA